MSVRHVLRWSAVPLMLATAVVASLLAAHPPKALAGVDMWITPGSYTINGRQWRTLPCEKYSQTIRCRTEIYGTGVTYTNGRFVSYNGWLFNNLTYAAASRTMWKGNMLATPGYHTVNGRKWYTECDTAKVGKDTCKSWLWTRKIDAVAQPDHTWSFQWVEKWVYNSQVRFLPAPPSVVAPSTPSAPPSPSTSPSVDPSNPCPGETYPDGYTITDGTVHAIRTPYQPNTLYNPTNIANFANKSIAAGNKCLGNYAALELVKGATRESRGGVDALWFPYMFEFSANPMTDTLQPGWISGLAQGASLSTFRLMYDNTPTTDIAGRAYWMQQASLTYNSYLVSMSDGGFTDALPDGQLWFEEYPTTPVATHVLNGHLQAVIALGYYITWLESLGEPVPASARTTFSLAITDLASALPDEAVQVSQGTMSSYDLVRGYPAAPLRLVSSDAVGTQVSQNLPSGARQVSLPIATSIEADAPNLLSNSDFTAWPAGAAPQGWSVIAGTSLVNDAGAASWKGNGRGWTGLTRDVPATALSPGAAYRLSWKGMVGYPQGVAATSGRVVAYQVCADGRAVYLAENNITRSKTMVQQDMLIRMPSTPGCGLRIQLLQLNYKLTNTTVWYDDVVLQAAPFDAGTRLEWPLEVQDPPKVNTQDSRASTITVSGTGSYVLQAYEQGRWNQVDTWTGQVGTPRVIVIPERLTGRNIHWGYHEGHVYELLVTSRLAAHFGDTASAATIGQYASLFRPLAPSYEWVFAGSVTGSTTTSIPALPELPPGDFGPVPTPADPAGANQKQD